MRDCQITGGEFLWFSLDVPTFASNLVFTFHFMFKASVLYVSFFLITTSSLQFLEKHFVFKRKKKLRFLCQWNNLSKLQTRQFWVTLSICQATAWVHRLPRNKPHLKHFRANTRTHQHHQAFHALPLHVQRGNASPFKKKKFFGSLIGIFSCWELSI